MGAAGLPARAKVGNERGFTLAEMLVSLAITGLVAVAVLAALGQWTVSARHTLITESRVAAVTHAVMVLRERIAAMRPDKDIQNAGASIDLVGTTTTLDFTGAPPDAAAPDAPWRYRLARAADGDLILYGVSTLDANVDAHDPHVTGWQRITLLTGTADLAIRYSGIDPFLHTPGWQIEWIHRPTLPRLIRITVRFPAGDPRGWPDLYVRPRADGPDRCRTDPIAGRCAAAENP